MQQILNYTTKMERVFHLYQEQGEINKLLLNEDFKEIQEKIKDKVNMTEETEIENKVKDEKNSSSQYNEKEKKKKKESKKEIKYLSEDEANIDIKI